LIEFLVFKLKLVDGLRFLVVEVVDFGAENVERFESVLDSGVHVVDVATHF
jgi:hypothetical protein